MLKKSTLLHLRLPFSFYLMPVYFFALSVADQVSIIPALLIFVALHLFLYPASNAYNSYFDKDEESIGGLKHPPPVSRQLLYAAFLLDGLAWLTGLFISLPFAVMAIMYSLVSRAYSHPSIRLKKYPLASWLVAGFFQGFFTFMMVCVGLGSGGIEESLKTPVLIPAFLSSMLLWGSYPMTQVYQHREDSRRGDRTLSLVLGIRGTFYFTAAFFTLAIAGFTFYYITYYSLRQALLFQLFLLPMPGYFIYWLIKVQKNISLADFSHSMRLNTISAFCLNLFFLLFRFLGKLP
ncbi:UbiA family prenyltransferase [Nafulsella turpanensis]|uniref:UbiA family prenyltransferase n=1 Tax=Nafulsella turpanensis TaxID=1265690 RepID=UPI00034DBA26|nr:UbiA family prenyltransferase [Nafulsella turpanensis]